MKLDFDTTKFEKCPRKYEHRYLEIKCRHGVSSGSGCVLCGDVVPPLSGERPWWTPVWRLWYRWWG
jgi:hypothetical protein